MTPPNRRLRVDGSVRFEGGFTPLPAAANADRQAAFFRACSLCQKMKIHDERGSAMIFSSWRLDQSITNKDFVLQSCSV
jgi:hypothetical protein